MSFQIAADAGSFRFVNLYYILAFAVSFLLLRCTDVIKSHFLIVQKAIK